ncbi:LarC family nickel insertion protein [Methylobacterium sp. NEAU 140]|uniref:LarC family nickel insertion protein n=1 Tax=Methylobacterium sp. NEAU 140 TaxID=3064945 RepID=UPI0027354EB2|nr:LarC family nickel insertion protein [Methylobacterium sp. NEAU 140]MDP4024879.1 LarC family nickel insertion protein [Methylobacterium sp. NEAU 140]
MQIHLDALGGVAGDMFVAALLDAFPEHEAGTLASVRAALRPSGQAIGCELLAHNDGILSGRRFAVSAGGAAEGREQGHGGGHAHRHDPHGHHDHGHGHHGHHDHGHGHHGAGHHGHRPWARIRDDLHRADLAPAVRDHALAIFGHLAQAEARVHGIAVERVAFHEVGAWDSIADIAAAAHLIAAVGASAWSVSALPLGGGRVRTQHGPLPVPAPATTLLLAGFATLDDGVPGERVTPTGAAILRHLCGGAPPARAPRVLVRSGTGFGTRRLPGISNCLRVLAFDEAAPERAAPGGHREIGVIEFEVDDQSGEDLAMGLDALRAHAGVLDAVQMPVFGKKGRMMTHVRVLARAASLEAVLEACFRETTTIGLRHRIVAGVALPRAETVVTTGDRSVRVKTVERPGGRTAKAEADDALAGADHAARARLRREAEALALEGDA